MSEIQIQLPSKCKLYEGIDPSKITCRTLRGKDEMLIAEMSVDNFDKKFLQLLKNVLVGIEPEVLTLGDKLFLAIWLVINSYSKDFVYGIECNTCWQKFDYTVDLSKLEVVELAEEYQEPQEVKLPVSGKIVRLKLLRYSDILKIDELEKNGKNVWLLRYAHSIVSDDNIFEKEMFLEGLDAKDMMYIRAFHEKYIHGPKMEAKYECPHCGGVGITPIPFRLEMFLPSGENLKQLTRN